ncbi:TrbI/VirB10 family protein [Paraburkholderia terricola]|uniref:Type IV secretion system protein VirB10 n=1 Tax=Paraburkholderia terricola TaxID=169427 RepID=A0ABU1M268_9BURK|nr:TrbI/VirB10 family protein [Paraburkholderia terricola]MDR6412997.1 type IV secretion system protein VirB10 [Paraburkholderia terricola]MDR6484807.1 type IV secretion system protein VirB10 [Paraburkholderia terricola]
MTERNEMEPAASTDAGPQPTLDLPGRRKTRVGKLRLVLVALAVIALGASGVTIYLQRLFEQHQDAKQAALNRPKDSGASDASGDLETQKDRIKSAEERARAASEAAAAAAANSRLATPAGAASQPGGATGGQAAATSNQPRPLTPAERRLQGSVLVSGRANDGNNDSGRSDDGPVAANETADSSDTNSGGNTGTGGRDAGGLAAMARSMGMSALRGGNAGGASGSTSRTDAGDSRGSPIDQSLQPSKLQPMQASFRSNRHYLLSRNTMIRCGQSTAIRTDRPGLIGCPIAQDVWSDDGTTLLVRKGAMAKGEQRDAVIQGQGVIGAIWDEIDDGDVHIPLNSPATDPLGAAGIPAYVDEHFWLRFKGALMVSLIGDFGQALANKATGAGQTISFSNSSNATQDVAAETLRNTINIPPTAYSNQGSVINIFVARDVDLSSVYENVDAQGNPVGQNGQQ